MDTISPRLPTSGSGVQQPEGEWAMDGDDAGEEPHGQLRTLNHSFVTASLVAVGALLVAQNSESWWEAVLLASGTAAALVAVSQWAADRAPRAALPCLAVTATVWIFAVLVSNIAAASYGLAATTTVAYHQLPQHRAKLVAGTVAFAASVVVARAVLVGGDIGNLLVQYLVVAPGTASAAVVLTGLNQLVSRLTAQVEEARERDAELAVVRERVRFASDLHDIQGHTLHVVKLKAALAQKLVHSDAGRAEEELREIHALVGDTLTRTKELAHAQRRLNLSAELENAKNLFTAAEIDVTVERRGEVDSGVGELLGQVLRETTTNILRHAQAGQVRITLSGSGIEIVNDGVREGSPPELRGLSALRDRVAGDGGVLTVEQEDGRFLTAAEFPRTEAVATRKDDR
ncbi:sensor histidine kinase [Streptomyces xiaopingdaonensis]|uniref:sensor histidine kinase n=1 Tax=Streptomyces xiaopingdaonensis TaxID=1565415 RepID=UPI0003004833|nr:histidine kinase [Streptomyces xiaopingdaonensis]